MKKILTTIPLVTMLAACGGEHQRGADSDTVAITDTIAAAPLPQRIVLSRDSIGPIALQTKTDSLPQEMQGVYTSIEKDEGGDATQYNFYRDEEVLFTALDFGQGKAELIVAGSPEVKVMVEGEEVNIGTPFAKLLSLKGVKPEWAQMDDMGTWYWQYRGLWFAPDQMHLPEKLVNKLYNPDTCPTAADFPDTVTIGYIATGLPF